MIIAIDFDGTVVTHDFPIIGKDVGAVPVLKKLIANGHQIILFTMRSERTLLEAVNWYKQNGIPLYGINTNPKQSIWTKSPKAYAELYIDDAALGAPLQIDSTLSMRPFINWAKVEAMLKSQGIIK